MRKAVLLIAVVVALILLTHASAGSANASAPFYHVVRYGETLSSIAWRYGVTTYSLAYTN